MLKDLPLGTSYRKGTHDISSDFYIPCMNAALTYDRAVGYFNSTIYSLAWSALQGFVSRGGRIRILCSPHLSQDDLLAISKGYDTKIAEKIDELMLQEVADLLNSPELEKPTLVLASLISLGVLDIRIVLLGKKPEINRRLFHDKVGIFSDAQKDCVVFKGSMNETWSGLSSDGNLESIDVFLSWEGDREKLRVQDEIEYFNCLWKNKYPGAVTTDFPTAAKANLLQAADPQRWEQSVEEISKQGEDIAEKLATIKQLPTLREHQQQGLENWVKQGLRGILEHATGSGKTFTALYAAREQIAAEKVLLILVPSDLLLKQWYREAQKLLGDLDPVILLCGGGNVEWKERSILRAFSKPGTNPRVIISTIQTAVSPEFQRSLYEGDHLFLVADEVHRMGSPDNRKLLLLRSGPRLGLSATPKRFGDPEGSSAIFEYFNGVVSQKFTLQDAILANPPVLTPYFYYVHQVFLNEEEQNSWRSITKKLRPYFLSIKEGNQSPPPPWAKQLLIKRARIVKSAESKVGLAREVITKNYTKGQKWIIYCEDQNQMNSVHRILLEDRFHAAVYHSAMNADKEETLRVFSANGGILVSIRCLDEGVDIPSVSHALILASSKNPREFIQRRGRVLRRSRGKNFSYIHDAVVCPFSQDDEDEGSNILTTELSRAIEFGKYSQSPASVTEIQKIALTFGIDYNILKDNGFEDE